MRHLPRQTDPVGALTRAAHPWVTSGAERGPPRGMSPPRGRGLPRFNGERPSDSKPSGTPVNKEGGV